MKDSIVRIASAVWTLGFLATACCSLSVPPGDLGLFVGLFCVALVPCFLGARRYRIFGIVAMSLSLLFVGLEVFSGNRIKAQRAKIAALEAATNSTAIDRQK
jgi:cell division protein FtsW (lipid II flippase)